MCVVGGWGGAGDVLVFVSNVFAKVGKLNENALGPVGWDQLIETFGSNHGARCAAVHDQLN